MRIAIVINRCQGYGGGMRFSSLLIRGLKERGHEIAVCSWDTPMRGTCYDEFLLIGHRNWFTPSKFSKILGSWKFSYGRLAFSMPSALRGCIKRFRPEVVLVAQSEPSVLTVVPKDIKTIQYVHFPLEAKVRTHSLLNEFYRSIYWWKHYRGLRRVDAIVCNSKYAMEFASTLWSPIVPKEKFHVIYPAVDLEPFQKELHREMKVCYAGRIGPEKGIDYLVDVFKRVKSLVPDAKLTIVGDIEAFREVKEKYYPILLEKVRGIPDAEIMVDVPYTSIVDTLLTSRCMASFFPGEHFGIMNIEAQAAGCPPICAKGGGQVEAVIHGETGFLIESPNEMVEYMVKLLTDDKLFSYMSMKAREHAKNFSIEQMMRKWERLLEGI